MKGADAWWWLWQAGQSAPSWLWLAAGTCVGPSKVGADDGTSAMETDCDINSVASKLNNTKCFAQVKYFLLIYKDVSSRLFNICSRIE